MGSSRYAPWWYWPLSGLALLWGVCACATYFLVSSDPPADQRTFYGQLSAVRAAAGIVERSFYIIWAQLCLLGAVALLVRSFWAMFAYFVAFPVLFFSSLFALFSESLMTKGVPLSVLLVFVMALAVTGVWLWLSSMAVFRGWMRR